MILDITVKVLVGLLSLLIVIRLLGKKALSQMTPFDFVYLVLLGSFLEEGLFDTKVSFFHIIYAIFLWGTLIYIIEKLVVKYDSFKRILRGTPTDLIIKGKINETALKNNNLELDQLRTMLRSQGCFSIFNVQHATLETGGTLSVLLKVKEDTVTPDMLDLSPEENETTHLVIDEGKIDKLELEKTEKNEEWLRFELNKKGFSQIENIYCAEWKESTGLTILRYDDVN